MATIFLHNFYKTISQVKKNLYKTSIKTGNPMLLAKTTKWNNSEEKFI